jgi:hypothetical protein
MHKQTLLRPAVLSTLPCAIVSSLLVVSPTASAHHSFFGRFDTDEHMYLEGEVLRVQWRNPHAHIFLRSTAADGTTTDWDLESGSPTLMRRAGVPEGTITPGMTIRIAGYPPLTGKQEMFATNVQLPSGEEFLLQTGAQAKFGSDSTGDFSYRFRTEGDRSKPELGLFRIWTFTGADGFLFPESINRNFDLNTYPMTPSAKAALARFNPATDNPTNNCVPKGMPTIMEQPLPMEVLMRDGNVVLRIEEYDLTRTIHMDQTAAPAGTAPGPLGYSVGLWEGDTLVATTTHVNWPFFDQAGIPLSEQVVITERFTPIEDGSQMQFEMTVNDPVTFTRPVQLQKKWIYVPGVEILPFECEEASP